MVRMPIAEYLRDCGYNVLEAADASEAIAAVDAEGPVSLVFSDIRMPGKMDGVRLAEWFQSHYPEVPVLLTSGYNGGRVFPPLRRPAAASSRSPTRRPRSPGGSRPLLRRADPSILPACSYHRHD